jgi:hypothetical protein
VLAVSSGIWTFNQGPILGVLLGPLLMDAILPTIIYLGVQALASARLAAMAALVVGGLLVVMRLVRRQSIAYGLIGLGASLLAFLASVLLQRSAVFFLPDIITRLALAVLCLISAALRRPLVAWTSHLVRGWPPGWYWHARVLPAYNEVTLAWSVYFLLQALVGWILLEGQQVVFLAIASLLNGWPATIVLLLLSYLYGTWRLARLVGPSVAEFQSHVPPPWTSQRRGF